LNSWEIVVFRSCFQQTLNDQICSITAKDQHEKTQPQSLQKQIKTKQKIQGGFEKKAISHTHVQGSSTATST
jgi:hypothetical protein